MSGPPPPDPGEDHGAAPRLNLPAQAARAANGASSLATAVEAVLEVLCAHLGWPAGHASLVERGHVELGGVWHLDDPAAFAGLREDAGGLRARAGPAGQVMASGQPAWIADDRLSELGIAAAIGVPVLAGDELIGALEFFSPAAADLDPALLDRLVEAARQLAPAVERERTVAALRRRVTDLERSNRELEQYAYVASHDLREPLRMVASYMALLKRRHGDGLPAEAHQFIDYAIGGAERMQGLIDDLLSYSQMSRTEAALVPTPLAVPVEHALANLALAREEAGATVHTGELPLVSGDAALLTQLFQNLVGNAIKFRGDTPPEVRIEAIDRGERWEVFVADNGIGIDPRFTERAFDVFQRLQPRGEYEGNGMGLAICRGIVERHGGRIWIEERGGRGTTVRFTLPAT